MIPAELKFFVDVLPDRKKVWRTGIFNVEGYLTVYTVDLLSSVLPSEPRQLFRFTQGTEVTTFLDRQSGKEVSVISVFLTEKISGPGEPSVNARALDWQNSVCVGDENEVEFKWLDRLGHKGEKSWQVQYFDPRLNVMTVLIPNNAQLDGPKPSDERAKKGGPGNKFRVRVTGFAGREFYDFLTGRISQVALVDLFEIAPGHPTDAELSRSELQNAK